MEGTRLCRRCRHSGHTQRCWHPKVMRVSPFDGKREPASAIVQREMLSVDACGPDGRFWEPRANVLTRLFEWWRR